MSFEESSLVIFGVLLTPVLLGLMFVPMLLEWKKPKDAGPRRIRSEVENNTVVAKVQLIDIEAPAELDADLVPLLDDALGRLSSLDS